MTKPHKINKYVKIENHIEIYSKIKFKFERKIKIKFLHKNNNKCLHEILAIIRTERLIGRAILLTNSIKTKTGTKIGGDLGGVKFININIILKLKVKIEIQNLKELINIKIVLVIGTPKGNNLVKFKTTKINLVYCKTGLKFSTFVYKI